MTLLQALWMAVLQGISELFPISSLGHAVIVPALFGWHIDQNAAAFLPFLVVLHLGTAMALALYFWREWLGLAQAAFGYGEPQTVAESRQLLGLMVVATLPAVIVGFAFEKALRHLFGSPMLAAAFLLVNGVVLFAGERLKRRIVAHVEPLTWRGALAIGIWQCAALVPGISRTGTTLVGGLLAGLNHNDAARFSFLIATPVIGGAAALEIPKLLNQHGTNFGNVVWIAGGTAAIAAYTSVAFLMRYFQKHDFDALNPFAYYCWAVGTISLTLLSVGPN